MFNLTSTSGGFLVAWVVYSGGSRPDGRGIPALAGDISCIRVPEGISVALVMDEQC